MKTPLILIILLSALASASCTEYLSQFLGDEKLKQNFMQAIKPVVDGKCDGDSIVFRLDTLTKFKWDKVYFAYSYSGDARINSHSLKYV